MRKLSSLAIAPAALLSLVTGLPFVVGGCGGDAGEQNGVHTRPNVLLISLDSTRRDLLSAYGYRSAHAPTERSSPNLDQLAAEGVLFENAYATTSWTLPSHLSMLTGQPELVHAVDIDYHQADPLRPTMAEILASYGYRTAGFYTGPYLAPHFGFDRGFARYESCYGSALTAASKTKLEAEGRLARARNGGNREAIAAATAEDERAAKQVELLSHRDESSGMVAEAVLDELEQAASGEEPFFVFAHFFDPHYDYAPPEPFDVRFDPDYAGDIDGLDFIDNERVAGAGTGRPGSRVQACSDRDLEHILALYAGELAWTDAQIGRILDGLAEHGLAENTLVIVTADHGDEFFEHGSLGHRLTLYEESVAVPLILRLPGRLPSGERVQALASTIDLLPTVLELTGLPSPSHLVSDGLVGLIDGREDGTQRGIFGRIVRTFGMTMPVPPGEVQGDRIPGRLVRVTETYRKGAIKITRERSWTKWSAQLSTQTEAMLQERSRQQKERELLVWIDVERHPDEPLPLHSADFSGEELRALLREYHDRYAELLEKRGHADIQDNDEYLERLRGLGYVDAGPGEPISSSEFTLPPPGASILGL